MFTCQLTLQGDVLTYLDMYKNFIIGHDIPTAIQGKCNYLAALGLSTYTEVFGGLFRGRLDQGQSTENYNVFIDKFFGSKYTDVDARLRTDGLKGLYGAVRSGLVHEYLIKDISMVVMDSQIPIDCGIIYDPNSIPKIVFVVKRYFSDFITAFKKYESRVKKEQKLVKNVELALNSIGSKLPRSRPLFK